MIRVSAASRLHFGLFAPPAKETTDSCELKGQPELPARHFGGLGLMIEQPGVRVAVQPGQAWSATGPAARRALQFGQSFLATLPGDQRSAAFQIVVEQCAAEHVGLGVGTQLALSVARALAMATAHGDWDAVELAGRVSRGLRSGIGIHGFQHGGLIVDSGKARPEAVAPLIVHHTFAEDWRILLILPRGRQGTHGAAEEAAFAHFGEHERDLRRTESLCRLALLGLLPALADRDLPAFGEALHEFNRRAGEWFLPCQGGHYADAATEERITWLRRQGIRGVGQSSWGPTIFAVECFEVLESLRQRLLDQGELQAGELILCRVANQGAQCEEA